MQGTSIGTMCRCNVSSKCSADKYSNFLFSYITHSRPSNGYLCILKIPVTHSVSYIPISLFLPFLFIPKISQFSPVQLLAQKEGGKFFPKTKLPLFSRAKGKTPYTVCE